MGRFGKLLLVQIEGWRLSSTGTLTGEKLRHARIAQGGRWVCLHQGCWVQTVARTNRGISSPTGFSFVFFNCVVNIDHLYFQIKHISVPPGKKHSVEVFGSHITTSRNPSTWKLEGKLSLHIH